MFVVTLNIHFCLKLLHQHTPLWETFWASESIPPFHFLAFLQLFRTPSPHPTLFAPNITTLTLSRSPYVKLWPQLQRSGQLSFRWNWKWSNFWAHLSSFLVELFHFVQITLFWSKVRTMPCKYSLPCVTPSHSCPYQAQTTLCKAKQSSFCKKRHLTKPMVY